MSTETCWSDELARTGRYQLGGKGDVTVMAKTSQSLTLTCQRSSSSISGQLSSGEVGVAVLEDWQAGEREGQLRLSLDSRESY